MPVKGDIKELKAMRAILDAPEQLHRHMLEAAAAEAKHLVQMGFRNETDPYGNKWAPLKSRPGGMILRQTARMANSFTSEATGTGFRVGSNVKYVTFHQFGTSGLSKDYSRLQAFSSETTVQAETSETTTSNKFVRESGKARVRVGDPRYFLRGNQVRRTLGRKALTFRGVAGHVQLNFKKGSGAIPARPMVPNNGQLSIPWQTNIDRICNNVMMREILLAGGTP